MGPTNLIMTVPEARTICILVLTLAIGFLGFIAMKAWTMYSQRESAGVVEASATVKGSVEEVFDYLVDFSNSMEWDPGVHSANRPKADGPIRVGSTSLLITLWKGRLSPMAFRVEALENPAPMEYLIMLNGVGDFVTVLDTFRLTPAPG